MAKIYTKEELDKMIESEKGFDNKGKKDLAIHKAAINGDLEGVKYLLQNGYKVTTNGKDKAKALHYAVSSGNYELVEFLLKNKSKVNHTNIYKETPLHYISEKTTIEIIELLIENGADINIESYGKLAHSYGSPYYKVLLHGNTDVIKYFIKNAKLIATDSEWTILRDIFYYNPDAIEITKLYLNSIGKTLESKKENIASFMAFAIEKDREKKEKRSFPKILFRDYNIENENIISHILKHGDLEFIKILENKNFDFNSIINDEPAFLQCYRENSNTGVRDYILNNKSINLSETIGNKDDFYYQKDNFYYKPPAYSSLLFAAVLNNNLKDVKFILENNINRISLIIISQALYMTTTSSRCSGYDNDDEIFRYLFENYHNEINLLEPVTENKDKNLIDFILEYNYKDYIKILLEDEKTKDYTENRINDYKFRFKTQNLSPKELKNKNKEIIESLNKDLSLSYISEYEFKKLYEWKKFAEFNKEITTGILWGIYSNIDDFKYINTFFVMEDGSFMDLEENTIEDIDGKYFIRMIHPGELTEDELNKAKTILEDYEINQPVKQLNRYIYKVSNPDYDYFDEFDGIEINTEIFIKRLKKNLKYGRIKSHDGYHTYSKNYDYKRWRILSYHRSEWLSLIDVDIIIIFTGYHQETSKIKSIKLSKPFKETPDFIVSEMYHSLKNILI